MPRATRYPLHLPVRYRAGGGSWHQGTTENISRSGVLLRAGETITPDVAVELVVQLPPVDSHEPAAEVLCRGRVVRAVPPADDDAAALVGATITHYQLRRSAE